ncbi:STAS domain-containing protein [Streptomyces ziwulingensis]|uniref:Anti-sigma factor antagonist n=1 Tax=Streptomyces ziwulingensis TaxID=1045501 RepID=A0ABP9C6J2_9ACTN
MTDTYGSTGRNRLSITRTSTDGISVLTVGGEIDHTTVPQLQQALESGREASAGRTVLDFQAVTFMDSSGINALVAAHRSARASGGWVRLAGPTEPVLRVIQIVGLDAVITCHPSLQQALCA